jgi:hypothetical protein
MRLIHDTSTGAERPLDTPESRMHPRGLMKHYGRLAALVLGLVFVLVFGLGISASPVEARKPCSLKSCKGAINPGVGRRLVAAMPEDDPAPPAGQPHGGVPSCAEPPIPRPPPSTTTVLRPPRSRRQQYAVELDHHDACPAPAPLTSDGTINDVCPAPREEGERWL